MWLVRPKLIGTLKIRRMMAGNLAVVNDIKNAPNKIIVQCESFEHGEDIIAKIKAAPAGERINL